MELVPQFCGGNSFISYFTFSNVGHVVELFYISISSQVCDILEKTTWTKHANVHPVALDHEDSARNGWYNYIC
jgi:hypothetical protein